MGFHTDDYCLNFVDCCQRILGCQLQRQKMLVQHHGRVIQVKALPIGIPYSQFESFSLTAPTVYGENNSQKVCTKKKSALPIFNFTQTNLNMKICNSLHLSTDREQAKTICFGLCTQTHDMCSIY